MSKTKFVLNRQGVAELMKSEEMRAILEEYGKAALGRLGSGYEMTTHVGKNRANVSIRADTWEAKRENSKNNSILKAVRG